MYAECLRCLERSFHMQDEIKLQVKKETPHVKIFIYEIFLTVSIRFGTNVPSPVRNKLSTKSTTTKPKAKF